MKNVIVGVSGVDFKGSDGQVTGTKLYLENENVEVYGMQTSELFLKSPRDTKLLSQLQKGETLQKFVGMVIGIDYDKRGKLVDYSFEV